MNAMIFILLIVDDYDPQVCVDDVHYYKATPLCLTTASKPAALLTRMRTGSRFVTSQLLLGACSHDRRGLCVVVRMAGLYRFALVALGGLAGALV
jgi:hypothetical protein